MLKLRKILLHSYPFYIILILTLILSVFRIFALSKTTSLKESQRSIKGVVDSYKIKEDYLSLKLKYKNEIILAYYYFDTKKSRTNFEKTVTFGDSLFLKGTLKEPASARIENGFSYKNYLNNKNIYYLMEIEELEQIRSKKSIYYIIKNTIRTKIKKAKKTFPYLEAFILGEDEDIPKTIKESFQKNGISHLFAISGMHVTLISGLLLSILKKLMLKEKTRYLIVGSFLFLYLLLTFSPSVLRATLFFFLFSINKIFYFHIKPFHLFLLTLSLTLLINPYFIYDIGFQYSYLISATLILASDYINKEKNYLWKLLKTSQLSFFSSSLISLCHFYELNFLSIFYNLFYVPLVSMIIFPLSFFVFLFPFLDNFFSLFVNILEQTSLFLAQKSIGKMILGKPSHLLFLFYIIVLLIYLWNLNKKQKTYYLSFLLLFLFQAILPYLENDHYLLMFDIGQGDSILIKSQNQVMLIDTGGVKSFKKQGFLPREKTSPAEKMIIPYLKSKGIRKIDTLVLTHGDYDHLGDAEVLLETFKIDHIYINNNKLNSLESRLKKHYKVEQLAKDTMLKVGNFSFYSLNGDLKEENDSSIVLLGKIENRKMLLMGDASCKTEKSLLKEYDIGKVTLLKVGHHGSKTSSCEEFLDEIRPEIALISAGIDNKFHHPHKIVKERFEKRKIKYYVTSEKGSIKIDLPSMAIKTAL